MNPDKVYLLYHEPTKTTWANCEDWNERRKTESIGYGEVEVEIYNVFEMKKYMEKDGYVLVKNNPYQMLNNVPIK